MYVLYEFTIFFLGRNASGRDEAALDAGRHRRRWLTLTGC